MAKKQSKTSAGIDYKALHQAYKQEREDLIKYSNEQGFSVRFMNGMFIVKDTSRIDSSIALIANKTLEPKEYTSYVRAYINKMKAVN